MSTIPRNCKVCGCLFDVPSAKISIEHCIMKELNTTDFLCVKCASKLIKWLQNNSIDSNSRSEVNSNIEKTEERSNKTSYSTVNIGGKIWMAENLAYDDGGDGIYYNQKNKEYYYTWEAGNRIAMKLGWRLPNDEDWDNACEECGGIKVNKWDDYKNCSLKNKLNIKLAGTYYNGSYYAVDSYGYFWSVSEYSSSNAWYRGFDTSASVTRLNGIKTVGYSVRLVKDSM